MRTLNSFQDLQRTVAQKNQVLLDRRRNTHNPDWGDIMEFPDEAIAKALFSFRNERNTDSELI